MEDNENINRLRGPYERHNGDYKQRIIEHARQGLNWKVLADNLGVKYHTAYCWIPNMDAEPRARRGGSTKRLTENQIDDLISIVEEDPRLTLAQIKEQYFIGAGVELAQSTIHNYLAGRLITLKKAHQYSVNMNTDENKEKRRNYVLQVSDYLRQNKYIIWLDETNFNLFCRRSQASCFYGPTSSNCLARFEGS